MVSTNYDGAGRIAGVKNNATGTYYAGAASTDATNRLQYSATGAIEAMKLGNNLWEHTNFNSRLQVTQIGLGTSSTDSSKLKLDYTYGELVNGVLDATKNNGNMQSRTMTMPGLVLSQNYTYDELNRLKSAQELNGQMQVWKQTFSYDRFGNRRFDGANTTLPQIPQPDDPQTNPTISEANNRISAAGYRYDLAGNMECDPTHPCGSTAPFTTYYEYDGDNKIKTANGGATSGGATYVYDGEGRRVKKIVGGPTTVTTVFVYDFGGQLLAEYSSEQPTTGGTSYLTADHLGTPRVITRADGTVSGRHDYQPFGEEISATYGGRASVTGYPPDDTLRQQFTSKERDVETGLDYFVARYYSSTQGRFVSPDAPFADQFRENPQSWNLYSYTRNNPVRVADKDGRITPWDILDIVSLALSVRDFWKQPSWSNAGWVAADAIGAILPIVPIGSIRRAKQLMNILGDAASARNLENATEATAFSRLSEYAMPLATGEGNVRNAVGMKDGGPVADILAWAEGNKFIISESKGGVSPDIAHAVEQLSNTAQHLADNVFSKMPSGELSRLEIVVHKGANVGAEFKISGDQLLKFNSATNKFEPVRIQGKVVHIVQIPPPPVPSSLPAPPRN